MRADLDAAAARIEELTKDAELKAGAAVESVWSGVLLLGESWFVCHDEV